MQVANLGHLAFRPVLQAFRELPRHPLQHHEGIPESIDAAHRVLHRINPVLLQIAYAVAVRLCCRSITTGERNQSERISRIIRYRTARKDKPAPRRKLPKRAALIARGVREALAFIGH